MKIGMMAVSNTHDYGHGCWMKQSALEILENYIDDAPLYDNYFFGRLSF